MTRQMVMLILALVLGCGPRIPQPGFVWRERHRVERVIDGDTVVLAGGDRLRLADIDAFEIRRGARLSRQAEEAGLSVSEALERGHAEAEALRQRLEGKAVTVEFVYPERDRWGRRVGTIIRVR
jgi:endonuclease YncB( thermonuclease family)